MPKTLRRIAASTSRSVTCPVCEQIHHVNPTTGAVLGELTEGEKPPEASRPLDMDWKPISTAPYAADLELALIDNDGPHPVAFPCRRIVGGWIAAETNKWITVKPTHWRVWPAAAKTT